MGNPDLKMANYEEASVFAPSSPYWKRIWIMDPPPPWVLRIPDEIRVSIYKEQLAARVKMNDLQIQALKLESEMLYKTMNMIK